MRRKYKCKGCGTRAMLDLTGKESGIVKAHKRCANPNCDGIMVQERGGSEKP